MVMEGGEYTHQVPPHTGCLFINGAFLFLSVLKSAFAQAFDKIEKGCARAKLNKADRQIIHSGSMAVRAIIVLYCEAFGHGSDRVQQLYGEVLVFVRCR